MEDEDGQPEIWVMGGSANAINTATVEAYNLRTKTWRSCLPMSQRRMDAVAGVVGGRLVVAGGLAEHPNPHNNLMVHLSSVEAYTPTGWIALPPLPYARNGFAASVLNGRLYVMGGESKKLQVLATSEETEFSWTVKADLPTARRGAAGAVHDGKLWLIGGQVCADGEHTDGDNYEGTESVLIYDTGLDSWAAGPPLPRAVADGSATVFDGAIYLFSGEGTFVYREAAWTEMATVVGRRSWPACESMLMG